MPRLAKQKQIITLELGSGSVARSCFRRWAGESPDKSHFLIISDPAWGLRTKASTNQKLPDAIKLILRKHYLDYVRDENAVHYEPPGCSALRKKGYNVYGLWAEARYIPFQNNTVSAIIAQNLFSYPILFTESLSLLPSVTMQKLFKAESEQRKKAVEEMHRVLRAGGRITFADYGSHETEPFDYYKELFEKKGYEAKVELTEKSLVFTAIKPLKKSRARRFSPP